MPPKKNKKKSIPHSKTLPNRPKRKKKKFKKGKKDK